MWGYSTLFWLFMSSMRGFPGVLKYQREQADHFDVIGLSVWFSGQVQRLTARQLPQFQHLQ